MWVGGWPCCRLIPLTTNNSTWFLLLYYTRKSELQMRNEHAVGNRRQKDTEERWERGANRKEDGSDHFWSLLLSNRRQHTFSLLHWCCQFLFFIPNQNLWLQKSHADFENHKTVVCKTVDVKMKLKNFLAYQYVRQRPVDFFLPVASKKVTVPNSTAAWQWKCRRSEQSYFKSRH